MSLEVGVDTYISLEDAETYITTYIDDTFTIEDDAAFEVLLRQATTVIDRLYGGRFIGTKETVDQTLQWPRIVDPEQDSFGNVRDFTETPIELGQATCELALLMDDDVDPYAQLSAPVVKRSIEVDVIKSSYEVLSGSYERTDPLYKVTTVLAPVLVSSASSMRLVRG